VKDKEAKKAEEKLTTEQKIRREIIAWFWVGLVFLLINGAIGQARVIPPSPWKKRCCRRSPHYEPHRLRRGHSVSPTSTFRSGAIPSASRSYHFKPAVRSQSAGLRKARHRLAGDVVDVRDQFRLDQRPNAFDEPYTIGPSAPRSSFELRRRIPETRKRPAL